MENFATYILNEKNEIEKMIIAYYMSEKTGIFFDKSIVLRAQIAKMFLNYASLDVDKNEVMTAILLCNCKKVDNSQKIGKLETYTKEGAEYLASLGFDKKFCKICEQLSRYNENENEKREKESDILELIDHFSGLILKRAEREAFTPQEALIVLKERNLKNVKNRYIEEFTIFVNAMENVYIKDNVDVPVIRKLAFLAEKEKSTKSFIGALANRYSAEIDKIMNVSMKKQSEELLYKEKTTSTEEVKNKIRTAHKYTRVIQKSGEKKPLFSKEAEERIMNHQTDFRVN